jgi:hypothetical protein
LERRILQAAHTTWSPCRKGVSSLPIVRPQFSHVSIGPPAVEMVYLVASVSSVKSMAGSMIGVLVPQGACRVANEGGGGARGMRTRGVRVTGEVC